MTSEKTAFEQSMDESFTLFHQLYRLNNAHRAAAFSYLFDEKHFPKTETWRIAAGVLLWGCWLAWLITTLVVWATGSELVIESFLIKGDFLAQGRLWEALIIAAVAALFIFALGRLMIRLVGYCYLPISGLLMGLQRVETLKLYWIFLLISSCFWLFVCIKFGQAQEKLIFINEEPQLAVSTWVDWINPDFNLMMLFLGYPMLAIPISGMLVINILYYKYRPQIDSDKNWSAEGLDSHLLDGDADN